MSFLVSLVNLLTDNWLGLVLLRLSCVLGLAWLLHFASRYLHPTWRVHLWRGVVVVLFAIPAISLSAVGWGPELSGAVTAVKTPHVWELPPTPKIAPSSENPPMPDTAGDSTIASPADGLEQAIAHPITAREEDAAREHASHISLTPAGLELILLVGYLMILGALLLRLTVQSFALKRMLLATKESEALQVISYELAQEYGLVQIPRILLSRYSHSPFICGWSSTRVVLPSALESELSDPILQIEIYGGH
ncbi:MAG: hypothetical protein AAF483_13515 [Planctomycetota bacterium]